MANRHDWLSWDQYLAAHHSNLRRFEYFIIDDHVSPILTPTSVVWGGRFVCRDGLEIHVTRVQDVRRRTGRIEVRTRAYSYHALIRGGDGVRDVLRYDNAHPHPAHADAHHKHLWDGAGVERVEHVSEAGWPTLGDVLAEVESWWSANKTSG
ncbi:MAG: DUF6516 family protein [Dehalococcoidia bacterium]